ncbi:ArnT family glycosyltransferase [Undibacterium jejuense]|nr:glycosyltransferase family 39 protein [Undibacterium jejuense]
MMQKKIHWHVFAFLLAVLLFRCWFSYVLPLTGDEAYFVLWGEHPAGGYYDHPPMIGWWLSGLLQMSRAEWLLRLPSVLLPFVLAATVWQLLKTYSVERARIGAMLVILQPTNIWNVLITTDTPVVFFSVLSTYAYLMAWRRQNYGWYALSGLLLGAALLSKYFSLFTACAILAHVCFSRHDQQRWRALFMIAFCAMPAAIYHLLWNSQNGWVNFLFNLQNRNEDATFSLQTTLLYLLSITYLLTPFFIFYVWQQRNSINRVLSQVTEMSAIVWLNGIPLLLLGILSLFKTIGLHWLLSFMPMLVIPFVLALPALSLKRILNYCCAFAAVHLLTIFAIANMPMELWHKSHLYDGIVLTVKTNELLAKIAPYAGGYQLATDSYSSAATLAFHAQRPVAVYGEGSYHARQDDFLTDWHQLNGKNIVIVFKSRPQLLSYEHDFTSTQLRIIDSHGVRFYLLLGQNFQYLNYRDRVLSRIRVRYYQAPIWLPSGAHTPIDIYF